MQPHPKIHNILTYSPLPKIDQTRAFNPLNGNDAESTAASNLCTACRAEVSWSSRNEDGRKIDLFLSLDHPWFKGERLCLLAQVKSGSKYGSVVANEVEIKRAAIKEAQRSTHPICLVWVDRTDWQPYWAFIHPSTRLRDTTFGLSHRVTPASRFDLARCAGQFLPIQHGGEGVTIKVSSDAPQKLRKDAKVAFRQQESILSPVLGNICLTRKSWRHMTRAGRTLERKKASLEMIPYLKSILPQIPSSHWIASVNEFKQRGFVIREMEHVLRFDRVRISTTNATQELRAVVVRTVEAIRFPEKWKLQDQSSQQVQRKVVLLNAYHKSLKE